MPDDASLRQPALRWRIEPVGQESDALVLGVRGLRCDIPFRVEGGRQLPLLLLVDSGASFSHVNRQQAIMHGIAIPPREREVTRRTLTATGPALSRVRVGRLRGWWNAERQGHPLDFPVFIRMDDPPGAPAMLGLGGVVRLCRWILDGTPTPEEPFGALAMEDLR